MARIKQQSSYQPRNIRGFLRNRGTPRNRKTRVVTSPKNLPKPIDLNPYLGNPEWVTPDSNIFEKNLNLDETIKGIRIKVWLFKGASTNGIEGWLTLRRASDSQQSSKDLAHFNVKQGQIDQWQKGLMAPNITIQELKLIIGKEKDFFLRDIFLEALEQIVPD